jgi:hypothetical protein
MIDHFGNPVHANPTEKHIMVRIPFRHLVAAAATFACVGLSAGAANRAEAQQKRPNTVIIWGDDIGQSNTYYDWLLDHAFLLVPAQDYVGQFLMTFKDYPPRQKAASFNLDEVMQKIQESGGSK